MPSLHRRTLLLSASLMLAGSGCGALVDLIDGDSVSTVRLFATHAGTPDEGGFPDYGDSITTRVFTNDMGWLLSLSEVYVTTAEVRLVECSAQLGKEIEMFWGACPEDFVGTDDRHSLAIGAVTIKDSQYCRVDVTFAPYLPPEDGNDHLNPVNPAVVGSTIVITGVARRGEGTELEEVPFEVVSDAVVTARANISQIENGRPLTLDEENFARDLTILKTYDTFFSGVDFATATTADIEAAVLASLEHDTVIYPGSQI
ncbi:MAG: hypothetical protein R6X02_12600 [Enhygromyxa sp.]